MHRRILIVVDDDCLASTAIDEGLAVAQQVAGEVLFFRVIQEETVPPLFEPPFIVDVASEQCRNEVEQVARQNLADAARKAGNLGLRCKRRAGVRISAVRLTGANPRVARFLSNQPHSPTSNQGA